MESGRLRIEICERGVGETECFFAFFWVRARAALLYGVVAVLVEGELRRDKGVKLSFPCVVVAALKVEDARLFARDVMPLSLEIVDAKTFGSGRVDAHHALAVAVPTTRFLERALVKPFRLVKTWCVVLIVGIERLDVGEVKKVPSSYGVHLAKHALEVGTVEEFVVVDVEEEIVTLVPRLFDGEVDEKTLTDHLISHGIQFCFQYIHTRKRLEFLGHFDGVFAF